MTTPDFGASHSLNALYDAVPETSLAAYRGRRIVIPAPSYQFLTKTGEIDHARREAALGNLEALGAVPTLMAGALTQDGRYAVPYEVRAADFQAALTRDPAEADLVMPIRGGYGMTRLLPLLDWEAIGRAAVPMVGFSDFTAFNLALLAKTGRASWHGPMLGSFDTCLSVSQWFSVPSSIPSNGRLIPISSETGLAKPSSVLLGSSGAGTSA